MNQLYAHEFHEEAPTHEEDEGQEDKKPKSFMDHARALKERLFGSKPKPKEAEPTAPTSSEVTSDTGSLSLGDRVS